MATLHLATRHPLHICLLLLGDGSVKQATPRWTETHHYSARPLPLCVFSVFFPMLMDFLLFFFLTIFLCFLFLFIFILLHSALVASLRNSLASPRQIGQVRLDLSHLSTHLVWNSWRHGNTRNICRSSKSHMQITHVVCLVSDFSPVYL